MSPIETRKDFRLTIETAVDIGTPPQSIYAQLDTGSFELWINPDCSALSSASDAEFCEAAGQYNPDDSSTSSTDGESDSINYGIGAAEIDYYVDDIALTDVPDSLLEQVRFGVATSTEDQFAGILGLGFGDGVNLEYRNFVDELADQGVTNGRVFSIALGSKAEGEGTIIFGGVDASKFRGELAALPIIPAGDSPDGMARYWVEMSSMSLTVGGASNSWPEADNLPVFLDTGATLTLLPPSLVEAIAADFDSDGLTDAGFYSVDCGLADEDGSVDFAFGDVTVQVPYTEIIRQFSSGCYLGISPSEDYALLGDTFLRSAFVVFDLDDETVHIAQYENCGSSVQTIEGSFDLEGLTGSCGSDDDREDVEVEDLDDSEETSSSAIQEGSASSATGLPTLSRDESSSAPTETGSVTSSAGRSSSVTSSASETTLSRATTATTAAPAEETGESEGSSSDDSSDAGEDNAGGKLDRGVCMVLAISVSCVLVTAFM